MENTQNQHIGISRGGRNTKIHAVVDALGNPIHVHLTAGNCHDATQAQKALSNVPVEGGIVLADKAYGSKDIRNYIASRDSTYFIPPKSNEKSPWPCD